MGSQDYLQAFVSEPTVRLTGTSSQQAQQVQAAQNRVQKQASKNAQQSAVITGQGTQSTVNKDAQVTSSAANSIGQGAASLATDLTGWIAGWPTPGGLGLVIFAMFILMWAVIPVHDQGYTRLQLAWLTLTGRTALTPPSSGDSFMTASGLSETKNPFAAPPANKSPQAGVTLLDLSAPITPYTFTPLTYLAGGNNTASPFNGGITG